MYKASLAILVGLGMTGLASASDNYSYTCSYGKQERKIDVMYLQRESSVPCEVRYTKDGQEETLWNASYTKGYCEDKAAEFVKKQESWGWSCSIDKPAIDDSLPEDKEVEAEKKNEEAKI
ncbi:hypothetical protein [Endozoicomonas arenosclerae]|uniref:hypothetical protein n=1 Tax=Endozoicomonas arenosclerae TaxID=1633495 RepID=UPI0007810AE5|nr:hypothetical protein [Endozoicomonas arenosclerae]